jgi:amino-acid N-acetyltransferase
MSWTIAPAAPADRAAIRTLIEASGLPLEGLDASLGVAVVARDGDQVVGAAALELYGGDALLRSVAVAADRRGHGVGERLIEAVLVLGAGHGVRRFYLLTETAEGFFSRLGFRRVGRDDVPAGVRGSVEFRSVCPASATVMARP